MRINFSDNYVTFEISTRLDAAFFTENKPVNNHLKFGILLCYLSTLSVIQNSDSQMHLMK